MGLGFQAAEPTWERISLGLSGTVCDFVFDPHTSLAQNQLNGWIATSTRVYWISDVFDTGSGRTVTSQLTFSSASAGTLVRIETERAVPNFAAVARGVVSGSTGAFLNVTTDGVNWSSNVALNTGAGSAAAYAAPGLYVSGRTAGRIYSAESYSTAGARKGRISNNFGVSVSNMTSPNIDNAGTGAYALHIPFSGGDSIAFFGWYDGSTKRLYRANGTTQTNISPNDGGEYGAQFMRAIDTYPLDGNRLALAGRKSGAGASNTTRVYLTMDGLSSSPTWTMAAGTEASSTSGYIRSVRFAGDDRNMVFMFGDAGKIGVTRDYGQTYLDKRGDITSQSPGVLVNIAGG